MFLQQMQAAIKGKRVQKKIDRAQSRVPVQATTNKPQEIQEDDPPMEPEPPKELTSDAANDPPVTHHITLKGHEKSISALECDPSGARLITAGWDYVIKFWDFAGMTTTFKSFRSIDPVGEEDHGAYLFNQVRWSQSGDKFVMVKAHPQPTLYDRDGHEILPFAIGDRYITDMSYSKGHTAEVTGCQWSPNDPKIIVTGAKDSTVRLWDVETLHKKQVQVIKTSQGVAREKRAGVTCVGWSASGGYIYAGTDVGSIYVWEDGGDSRKPSAVVTNAHTKGDSITSCKVLSNGVTMVSRCKDDTVKLWDLRNAQQGPLGVLQNIDTVFDTCDVCLSPNENLIVLGTCVDRKSSDKGQLAFYDVRTLRQCYATLLQPGVSAIRVQWHDKLNQIIVGCSDGNTQVYYDPEKSTKGAKLCANKVKKMDPIDVGNFNYATDVITPNQLPLYREEQSRITHKRERRATMPDRTGVPPRLEEIPSFALLRYSIKHQHFLDLGLAKNTIRNQDPVATLRSYAKEAAENPLYIADVYRKSQPNPVFAEEEEETHDPLDMIEHQVAQKRQKILHEVRESGANKTV